MKRTTKMTIMKTSNKVELGIMEMEVTISCMEDWGEVTILWIKLLSCLCVVDEVGGTGGTVTVIPFMIVLFMNCKLKSIIPK